MMISDLTAIHAEVRGVQRLRRRACRAVDMVDRHTETDVRFELMLRLTEESIRDLSDWLDAQVVSLHDPCQTMTILGREDVAPPQTDRYA